MAYLINTFTLPKEEIEIAISDYLIKTGKVNMKYAYVSVKSSPTILLLSHDEKHKFQSTLSEKEREEILGQPLEALNLHPVLLKKIKEIKEYIVGKKLEIISDLHQVRKKKDL